MTIYEQVDMGCACSQPTCRKRFRYCWMLSRAYATRAEMIRWGWKWIAGSRGCRGVFVTNDPAAVDRARAVLRLPEPVSNGSHARMGAPMHDLQSARDQVRREYVAAGLDADLEIDGFAEMTAADLRDQLVYLADYQG